MRRVLTVLLAIGLLVGLFAAPAFAGGDHDGSKTINAKALNDHECDSSEWHFVITQVKDESKAPDSIKVTFSGGDTVTVPLDKFTGKTAHYTTTANLDEQVVKATAKIYKSWKGQFNLSHGPCGEEPPPPPPHKTLECPGSLELDKTVVRAKAGSQTLLLTASVVEGSQGKEAVVTAIAENNSSVHPGNDLVIESGGSQIVVPDVEGVSNAPTPGSGTLTLGSTLTITLVMGQDEVFSGGITLEIDCPEPVTVPSGNGELVCEYTDGASRAMLSYEVNDPDGVVTAVSPEEGEVEDYPFDGSPVTVTIEYVDEFDKSQTTAFEVEGLSEGCEPPPTTTPPTTAPPTTAPPTTAPPTTEPPTTTTEPEPLPQPGADSNCEAFWVENIPGPGSVTAVYTPVGKGSVSRSVSVDTDFVERMKFRVLKADLGQNFSWTITVRSGGFEQMFEGKETDCAPAQSSTTGPAPSSAPQGAGMGWLLGTAFSALGGMVLLGTRKRS